MILVLAIVVAILIALFRGGSLSRLAQVPFQHGWLAFVALGLQVAAVYMQQFSGAAGWVFASSYAILVALVVANWQLTGMPIMGLGLGLNALVMAANGGYMPVSAEAVQRAGLTHLVHQMESGARVLGAKDMILAPGETSLWLLSDLFVLPGPWPSVFSIGDVYLALGVLILFHRAMLAGYTANGFRKEPAIANKPY